MLYTNLFLNSSLFFLWKFSTSQYIKPHRKQTTLCINNIPNPNKALISMKKLHWPFSDSCVMFIQFSDTDSNLSITFIWYIFSYKKMPNYISLWHSLSRKTFIVQLSLHLNEFLLFLANPSSTFFNLFLYVKFFSR